MSNLVVRIVAQNLAKRGFTQASADVKRFEATVQKATARLGRMALAAAAVSAVGLVKFASFDKSIREIGTLLDDVTEQDIKKMGREVERMSIRFGTSVEKMAKAKYDIISAGFKDAADSAKMLDVAARLAAGGVSDVAKTADVLTSVLNAYGMSADQAEHASDVLFTTVRLGKTTIDELSAGLGRAVAIAPLLGVSFEALSAATAALTAQGQSTEETITALTQVMNSLLSPQKDLAERFIEVGIQSGAASVRARGFAETLRLITEGADEAELATYFGNIRAFRAVAPLVTTAAKTFADNIVEMGSVAGATDTAFAKMEKGISFKLGQLRQIGERVLRRFGAWVADLVMGFANATPAVQNLAIAVGALGLAFKLLSFWPTVFITLGFAAYQAWDKNIFGIRELVTRFAEEITHLFNETIDWVVTSAKIIAAVVSKNWAEIAVFVAVRNVQSEEEYKRHTERMLAINEEFAGAYVGTWKDFLPDFVSMLGLGDIAKIEEKGAETVAAVTEAVIVPIETARMESAARAAGNEITEFDASGKQIVTIGRRTTQAEYKQWNRAWKSIAQSGINQVGNFASQQIGQAFRKLVGEQKTVFGQLWSSVLQNFLSMMAAMAARWIAFKALTSIGLGGLFFSRGGIVPQYQIPKVQRAQVGMISQGFDTVPAMLRRGEAVIPTEQTRDNLPAIRQIMSGQSPSMRGGGDGGGITIINNISAIDAKGVYDLVQGEEFKSAIVETINNRQINLNANNVAVEGAY